MDEPNYYSDLIKLTDESRLDSLTKHLVKLSIPLAILCSGLVLFAIGEALHLAFWFHRAVGILMMAALALNLLYALWSLVSLLFRHER
jgi:hypothetical protein